MAHKANQLHRDVQSIKFKLESALRSTPPSPRLPSGDPAAHDEVGAAY